MSYISLNLHVFISLVTDVTRVGNLKNKFFFVDEFLCSEIIEFTHCNICSYIKVQFTKRAGNNNSK